MRDDDGPATGDDTGYARLVGARLRAIRRQKNLSLQDVEVGSDQEFKASVLGAYERGERAISVPRLHRLAAYYSIPIDQLLPKDPAGEGGEVVIDLTELPPIDRDSVVLDLQRVERLAEPERDRLRRYLNMIQLQRGDFNGRVITVRRDDLRAIAVLLDADAEGAQGRIDEMGLRLLT